MFEEKIKLLYDEKAYMIGELEKVRIKSNEPTRDFLLVSEPFCSNNAVT